MKITKIFNWKYPGAIRGKAARICDTPELSDDTGQFSLEVAPDIFEQTIKDIIDLHDEVTNPLPLIAVMNYTVVDQLKAVNTVQLRVFC